MKNIRVIALSLLSVMIGACNITNASNSQHDNTLGDINNNTIYEIAKNVVDNFVTENKPINDINREREIVAKIYNASNDKSLDTIIELLYKTIIECNFYIIKRYKNYEILKYLTQDEVSKILIEIIPNDIVHNFVIQDKPINYINREIVTRIYNASNNKSLDTITKLVNEIIDKSNDHMKKVRQDYKYLNHLTQDEVSKIIITEIPYYVEDSFIMKHKPIDKINEEIVTRIYNASNNKSLDTITKLVNKTIDESNANMKIVCQDYKNLDYLTQDEVSKILIVLIAVDVVDNFVIQDKPIFQTNREIVKKIYDVSNDKSLDTITKLVNETIDKSNAYIGHRERRCPGSDYKYFTNLTQAEVSEMLIDIIPYDIVYNFVIQNKPINNIYKEIVTRVYEIRNDKPLDIITKLVNNTISDCNFYIKHDNRLNRYHNKIEELTEEQVSKILKEIKPNNYCLVF